MLVIDRSALHLKVEFQEAQPGCLVQKKKPQLIAQLGLITSRKISLFYSGNITVSIRCTTPFFAIKSVAITFAPAIETWPPATTTA